MTINAIQDEIIEEFELFDNWTDKYAYIVEIGKKLPDLAEEHKTEENIIKGCQSKVWMTARMEGDQAVFDADSDAIIVKGLISLLLRVLSNQTPEEIAKTDLYFMEKIGLAQHLSMTRSNGLAAMVKQIKLYAVAFQAMNA